jgi:hypothetical protein
MHGMLFQAEKAELSRWKIATQRKRLRQILLEEAESNVNDTFSALFLRTPVYNGTKSPSY